MFCIVGNLICIDRDIYLCSRCKQQPQGYFDAKMPAVANDIESDTAANATERYLVSTENIAYLKWLTYSAAFKEQRGATHVQFYLD